ncbi:hypothetical protein [Rummeliibacillus sp. SL167]|uniref:hypothetical protein n=1 Tax=Rummeliibacillus sp. SL167 TaxID=2579792 RepID=UPI0016470B76|nr:hypothetical protein [Rummeliibacillus sp. SL167]
MGDQLSHASDWFRQDVGPSGVAIGCGAFHFHSSISVLDEENLPLMEASLYM